MIRGFSPYRFNNSIYIKHNTFKSKNFFLINHETEKHIKCTQRDNDDICI